MWKVKGRWEHQRSQEHRRVQKVGNIVEGELTEKYSDKFNPALVPCGVGDMADGEVEAIWRAFL